MIAVIMAGGKGTRIAELNSELPKPMLSIAGKPILEHAIICLARQEISEIILVVGYKSEKIVAYCGDGKRWNVKITYILEDSPLGTAGALYYLKDKITEDFFLINGDIIFDVNLRKMLEKHKQKKALATIFTHPNNHPYDSGVIVADEESRVINWLHKEDVRIWYQNRVNAGIHILSPNILNNFKEAKKVDLDRDILKYMILDRSLFCYDSPEYVRDVGTPERFHKVEKDIINGVVQRKNQINKQKAIFLDRDGTINKYSGFIRNIEEFELLPKVADAIKRINESEYLAIVITNQPVIARGEVTISELRSIHDKMETLLGNNGAYIDDLLYCPHHPDSGYIGEIKALKIKCECRKPKPGLIIEAAEKFNIDLKNSWMIGDSKNDIQAGISAGCKVALLSENNKEMKDIIQYRNLYDCIDCILRGD